MTAYFDSTGRLEMAFDWEKSTFKITIDAFGNRIKLKSKKNGQERLFILGQKGKKYKSSGALFIIPYYQCTDDKEVRCNIRLMLQEVENISKLPSYLYIDYADITYVYQLFWDTENIQDNLKSENTENNPTISRSKQGCLFVSDNFASIKSAEEELDNTSFSFQDTYYPSSGNIKNTSFYACEKKDGHMSLSLLIVKTTDTVYIFRNVPRNIWIAFRKAKSAETYFEKNIKNKYKNVLNASKN